MLQKITPVAEKVSKKPMKRTAETPARTKKRTTNCNTKAQVCQLVSSSPYLHLKIQYGERTFKIQAPKTQRLRDVVAEHIKFPCNTLRIVCMGSVLKPPQLELPVEALLHDGCTVHIFRRMSHSAFTRQVQEMDREISDTFFNVFKTQLSMSDEYLETDGLGIVLLTEKDYLAIINFEGNVQRKDYEVLL